MTRQTEVLIEVKQDRRVTAAGKSVVYQLEGHLQRDGTVLRGISLRTDEIETLMVLRANVEGNPKVAFIGGADIASCFIKAATQAGLGRLTWVVDKFAE